VTGLGDDRHDGGYDTCPGWWGSEWLALEARAVAAETALAEANRDAENWSQRYFTVRGQKEDAEQRANGAEQALTHHGYGPRLCKCLNCAAVAVIDNITLEELRQAAANDGVSETTIYIGGPGWPAIAALIATIDDLADALRAIAGNAPDGSEGFHFVGDEHQPGECPGCIARAALDRHTHQEPS
jgi:hypothetical protein